MHKALNWTVLLGGAAILVACSDNDGRSAMGQAEDKVAEGVGQISANAWGSNSAENYVVSASMGDLYEVRAADLALSHAQSDEVKELARMIKADHTDATEKLKTSLGANSNASHISTDLDERRKGMLDNLSGAADGNFDKAYLEQQVAAHEEAVTLHRGFADNSDEPQLSAHARTVLPKIEAHLNKSRELLSTITSSN